MAADIFQNGDLALPESLPDFQKMFPNDAACAAYLERLRWPEGFRCPHCSVLGDPYRFTARPGVLRCRKCRKDTGLTAGTVMESTRSPLTVWFWAAFLVATTTAGMSATNLKSKLGLTRYETAFQILHKLRAGMVRPDRDRIGGDLARHVEVDETYVGGTTRGKGKGVHNQAIVIAAVEVRQREPSVTKKRRGGRYAGRLRIEVVPDRTAESLCGFIENAVMPGAMVVTDGWVGYHTLKARGYEHLAVVEAGSPDVAEEYLPIVHLIFSNLKAWIQGCHHGVSPQHLQAYLNEFTFRFNRRFYPANTFRSLLGIGTDNTSATYAELYSGDWEHPTTSSGHG